MKLGFMSALALLLIALKLSNIIDWSWWLVLAPLWAPVALFFLTIAAFFIAAVKTPGARVTIKRKS